MLLNNSFKKITSCLGAVTGQLECCMSECCFAYVLLFFMSISSVLSAAVLRRGNYQQLCELAQHCLTVYKVVTVSIQIAVVSEALILELTIDKYSSRNTGSYTVI